MRLVGNHHFYISDESPGSAVCIELHRIASDVEIGPLDGGACF
jgi:hypothetical protein